MAGTIVSPDFTKVLIQGEEHAMHLKWKASAMNSNELRAIRHGSLILSGEAKNEGKTKTQDWGHLKWKASDQDSLILRASRVGTVCQSEKAKDHLVEAAEDKTKGAICVVRKAAEQDSTMLRATSS